MAIPFVIINLDKTYKLRLTMSKIFEFEKTTKKKLIKVLESNALDLEMACKLLHVLLKDDAPGLTYNDTIKLIDDHANSINEVINTVTEAIVAGLEGEKNPNAETSTEKE